MVSVLVGNKVYAEIVTSWLSLRKTRKSQLCMRQMWKLAKALSPTSQPAPQLMGPQAAGEPSFPAS